MRQTLLALLAVLTLTGPAHAVLVSYSFDVRGDVEDPMFWYGSPVSEVLHVTMTYESTNPGFPTASPHITNYSLALQGILVSTGPHLFATRPFPGFNWGLHNGDDDLWEGLIQGQGGLVAAGPQGRWQAAVQQGPRYEGVITVVNGGVEGLLPRQPNLGTLSEVGGREYLTLLQRNGSEWADFERAR